MKDSLVYQSDNTSILELLNQGVHFSQHLLKNFRSGQDQFYPAILQSPQRRVHMLRWGLENPIMPGGPELTYLYGAGLPKQESLVRLLKSNRVVIPVKKMDLMLRTGQKVTLSSMDHQMLYMAGVWYAGTDDITSFALITKEGEGILTSRKIPVFLPFEDIQSWLNPTKSLLKSYSDMLEVHQNFRIDQDVPAMVEA